MNFGLPSLRAFGPYLLVLLIVIRFLIMPLNSAAKQKKSLLAERQELYATEQSLLQRQLRQEVGRFKWDDETLARLSYRKNVPDLAIQADLVKGLIEAAEKKGLTLVNYEFPDVVRDKEVSEVGVILRLQGQPRGLVDLLKAIEDFPKPLRIKSMESSKSGADVTFVLTIAAFKIEE